MSSIPRELFLNTTLGSLQACVYQAQASRPPRLGVVLCHGYGAPGDDLVPLGQELVSAHPGLEDVRFFFPEAPLTLEDLGMPHGRAWWPIDLEHRIRLLEQQQDAYERFYEEVPDGLTTARRALLSFVLAASTQHRLELGQMVLGGFSQGAMLAADVALTLEEAPAGLMLLSGSLICRKEWQAKATRRNGLRVFQTHGTADPILPFAGGQALSQLLAEAGMDVSFHRFEGGHTIPRSTLLQASDFLKSLLEDR